MSKRVHYPKDKDIFVSFPDDLTHGQLNTYERSVKELIAGKEQELITDMEIAYAAISAAVRAKAIEPESEGIPTKALEIDNAPAGVTWWLAQAIGEYVSSLKQIDPN